MLELELAAPEKPCSRIQSHRGDEHISSRQEAIIDSYASHRMGHACYSRFCLPERQQLQWLHDF